ncbi:MAG: pyridoxamine 5'-phosphate oxidase family protein [Oscillospiraceae bacterium]|jgi:nitroimidazol reductase NimA-like FMN-containing flavoprotein (pyridoxamine 5'-phosphate oxidase superfamily)|nr:pyridoxamine 5'-phosphate oxidase family protein [Oscillospiraceae bacterium]
MFRPLRRAERAISTQEAWLVVETENHGVLSVTGDEGWPYGIPLNHVLLDGALYFHCAKAGHKLDALAAEPRACFTVVRGPLEAPADILPNTLGTYESAVVFGHVSLVADADRVAALEALCARYAPARVGDAAYFAKHMPGVAVLRMAVSHITGKRLLVK